MNNSTHESMQEVQFHGSVLASIFLVILMIFSITVNLVVCVTIVRCSKLQIATSVFIFNLCVSGILMTAFSMSMWLAYQIKGTHFFNALMKIPTILRWWAMVDVVSGTVGILSLTAISVVKYVAIARPLTYKTVINQRSKAVAIAFIWIYAFSVSSAHLVTWSHRADKAYFLTTLCLILPMSIIIIAYGKIYMIAKSQAQLVNVQAGRKKANEIKAAKTIAIIVGTFCFCWIPFFVVSTILAYTESVDENFTNIIKWLTYVNVLLNPLIYTSFDRRFRTVLSSKIINYFNHRQSNDLTRKRSVALQSMAGITTEYEDTSRGSILGEQSSMAEC